MVSVKTDTEFGHNIRRVNKGLRVKYLRTDMTVEAAKLDTVHMRRRNGKALGCAVTNQAAEFLIDSPCPEYFMCVGINTRSQAQEYFLRLAAI